MEKQQLKSKWDDLARELGAEVPPGVEQREQAVSTFSQETAAVPPAHAQEKPAASTTAPPKRKPAGWDSLATDLGLPPAESEPAPVAAVPPVVDTPREVSQPEPRQREREQPAPRPERQERERPRREQSENRRGRSDQPRENRNQRGGRGRRRDGVSNGREDDRGRERDRERGRDREHEQEQESRPVAEAHERPAESMPSREPPQKPAAVSLWHKIFGSPAEQTPKVLDEPVAEVVAPSDLRDEPRAAGSGFADAHADEPLQIEEYGNELNRDSEPAEFSDEAARSDQRPGRSRRRRGGRGRGRKSEEGRVEDRPPRQRAHASRPPRRETETEIAEDEFLDAEEPDDLLDGVESDAEEENGAPSGTGETRGSSILQRSIPSWDEAIGFIVETNMQTRSQRRPPSRSGPRDNSRGRSRGGRKN